jgi:hypothetical protein
MVKIVEKAKACAWGHTGAFWRHIINGNKYEIFI